MSSWCVLSFKFSDVVLPLTCFILSVYIFSPISQFHHSHTIPIVWKPPIFTNYINFQSPPSTLSLISPSSFNFYLHHQIQPKTFAQQLQIISSHKNITSSPIHSLRTQTKLPLKYLSNNKSEKKIFVIICSAFSNTKDRNLNHFISLKQYNSIIFLFPATFITLHQLPTQSA